MLMGQGKSSLTAEFENSAGKAVIRRPQMELEGYSPYYSYFIVFGADTQSLGEVSLPLFLDHMDICWRNLKFCGKILFSRTR